MADEILDVDLLAFERGGGAARRAVVDGVRRSLATGFVYTSHDLGEGYLDDVHGALAAFFELDPGTKSRFTAPGSNGQTGYTGLLVETAATAEVADWKEMLNWGRALPEGHPLRRRYPHRYFDPVLPDPAVPGIGPLLLELHDRLLDVQRRFLRIVALAIGCHEAFFDTMVADGATLTRAVRYPPMVDAPSGDHVWAAGHADINLVTALPRASAPGLQVRLVDGTWVDAVAPDGSAILNAGMMLERFSNGTIPAGWHRVVAGPDQTDGRLSVVQFAHPTPWTILGPVPSCVTEQRPLRYPSIEAGAALDQVVYEINLADDARP